MTLSGQRSGDDGGRVEIVENLVPTALSAGDYFVAVSAIWNPSSELDLPLPPQMVMELKVDSVHETKHKCQLMGYASNQPQKALYGTDLGFSAQVDVGFGLKATYFLFGDTWETTNHASAGPMYPTNQPLNDDLLAYTLGDLPASGCPALSYPTTTAGRFAPISLPGQVMNAYMTPQAAVGYGGQLYAIVTSRDSATPGLQKPPVPRLVRLHADGSAQEVGLLSFPLNDSLNGGTFWKFGAPAMAIGPGGPFANNLFVWGRGSFANSFNPTPPATSPVIPASLGDLYLMVIDADSLASPTLAAQFWGGTGWSNSPADLTPVLAHNNEVKLTGQTSMHFDPGTARWFMLYGSGNLADGKTIGPLCHTEEGLVCPIDDDLGNTRDFVKYQGGIYIRSAPAPWGPWEPSDRKVLFSRGLQRLVTGDALDPHPGACSLFYLEQYFVDLPKYVGTPGLVPSGPFKQVDFLKNAFGCVEPRRTACESGGLDPNAPCIGTDADTKTKGIEYGAAFVDGSFSPLPGGFEFDWTMSTLNPYSVHLMHSKVIYTP